MSTIVNIDKSEEVRLAVINQIERLESLIRFEMFVLSDFSLLPLQEILLYNLIELKNEDKY